MSGDPPARSRPVPGLDRGVMPSWDGAGVGNVAGTIADVLGADAPGLLPPLDDDLLPAGLREGAERVVLLVVDGLGWEAYREARPDLEALPALAAGGSEAAATSVLPSTTATALTTLHVGVGPARHGLVAPYVHLPEHDLTANLLRWTTADGAAPLADRGVAPGDVVDVPPVGEVLAGAGVPTVAVTRDQYVGSPLSEVLYRGADVRGYEGLDELAAGVDDGLEDVGAPGLVLAYWDGLDATGHLRGPGTDAWDGELRRVDAAVGALAEGIADPGTLLLVTSDHGFVPTPPPLAIDADDHPRILEAARGLLTGEVRWRFLAADEAGRRAVHDHVEDRLAHALDVLDQEELLEAGAYGPEPPKGRVRERYGDLVLVPRGERSIRVRYGEEPPPRLAGHHGGPTPEEMLVPLLAARPGT